MRVAIQEDAGLVPAVAWMTFDPTPQPAAVAAVIVVGKPTS